MASESSFDIVSKIDQQEVDNAINQAARELATRYDFKNTGSTVERSGDLGIVITSSAEGRATAALDVLKDKLVKRGVSLKALEDGEPRQSGKETKINCTLKDGLTQDQAKKIAKLIRDEGFKGVKTQVQGDELRVASKKRDDLQAVISLIKEADLDFATQFVNYR